MVKMMRFSRHWIKKREITDVPILHVVLHVVMLVRIVVDTLVSERLRHRQRAMGVQGGVAEVVLLVVIRLAKVLQSHRDARVVLVAVVVAAHQVAALHVAILVIKHVLMIVNMDVWLLVQMIAQVLAPGHVKQLAT